MRNPMLLLAFPATVMAIGAVATSMDTDRAQRQQWQQFTASAQVNSQIQSDRLMAESRLAETRYKSGACVLSELPLVPGMVTANLTPGSAVCDQQGTTAIVAVDSSLGDFARTNDTATIRRFLGW